MKKVNWTNNTDIRLGFEIECIINTGRSRTQFNESIRAFKRQLSIGSDGSIDTGWISGYPIEIRTRPLAPKNAIILLKNIFDIVNKYGLTNSSCGFHVNISSAHRTKMRNFNPIPFLSSNLWNEILKKFNRISNMYCRPVLTVERRRISNVHFFKELSKSADEKFRCVTLCNFGNGLSKSSRVEVRGFGNTDYTQKFDTIVGFVKRIERLFKLSCGNLPFTRTFSV